MIAVTLFGWMGQSLRDLWMKLNCNPTSLATIQIVFALSELNQGLLRENSTANTLTQLSASEEVLILLYWDLQSTNIAFFWSH